MDEVVGRRLTPTLYTEPGVGGVLISGLSPLSPSRAAGLRPGDVIVQVNGRQIASREDFYRTLWQAEVDHDVQVTVEGLDASGARVVSADTLPTPQAIPPDTSATFVVRLPNDPAVRTYHVVAIGR